MRPRQLALAAVMVLACGDGAAGAPLITGASAALILSHGDIQAAGWRYYHRRDYSWRERESNGANPADTNGLRGSARLTLPDSVQPAPRRHRGWVDPPPLE
jgi:hypothetical protein